MLTRVQYQELFSVYQAFSGPGSTKMHYCIILLHHGFLPALLGFLLWRYVERGLMDEDEKGGEEERGRKGFKYFRRLGDWRTNSEAQRAQLFEVLAKHGDEQEEDQ